MKIALISRAFSKNMKEATNITLINFATELSKNGHEVVIFSEGRKGLPNNDECNGIRIVRNSTFLFVPPLNKLLSIPGAVRRTSFKPDIVHGFSSAVLFAQHTINAGKRWNAPTIHTIKSKSDNWWGNKFYTILNKLDLITVATQKQKNELVQNGVSESKIKLVHSHINTQKFKPMDKEKLKKKYGYTGKKVILYYGAMRDDKGTWDLYQSMGRVLASNSKVIYLYICRFKEIEEKYQAYSNVKIITDDVPIEEYVAMADLAIFPYRTLTRTESNPSCALECLSAKTPVITTNLEELKEILTDNQDCLMVDPENPDQITDKTIEALKNKKLLKTLADNGLKTAQKFDVKKVTKEFEGMYGEMVRK
jgi:glycosyltransferase involved in cell wall biosynthesis